MKRTVKIIRVGEERSGVSEKTGSAWKSRDLDVKWEEEGVNGEFYDQCVNASINGDTNAEALNYHANAGTKFEARLYFGLASAQGRTFNRIRIYLPEEANRIPTF